MVDILGTLAKDVIDGSDFDDILSGLGGEDEIYGLNGNDTILGGSGDDYIEGGGGSDNLDGGTGYDRFVGGQGNDTIKGGTSTDPGSPASWTEVDWIDYYYEGGTRGVDVNLATGTGRDTFSNIDTLVDIEGIVGTANDDRLTGGNRANDSLEIFVGYQGNDAIDGGTGYDVVDYYFERGDSLYLGIVVNLALGTIRDSYRNTDTLRNIEEVRGTGRSDEMRGSIRNDRFEPSNGSDYVDGGGGSDTVSYRLDVFRDGLVGIVADLTRGTAIDTLTYVDTLVSIENVIGSAWGDVIRGNGVANKLEGGDGEDVLKGLNGNDTLLGGNGADTLFGGLNTDILDGGAGNDILRGGIGIDRFVFDTDCDEDIIRDFVTGVDKIDLRSFNFASTADVLARVTIMSAEKAVLDLGADNFVIFENVNTAATFLAAGDILV